MLLSWECTYVCDEHVSIRLGRLRAGLSVVGAGEGGEAAETEDAPLVAEPRGSCQQGKDQYGHQDGSGDDAVVETWKEQTAGAQSDLED